MDKIYPYTSSELTSIANHAIDVAYSAAHKKGIIDNETFEEIKSIRVAIIDDKNFFSKFFSKLCWKEDRLRVVAVETIFDTEESSDK